MKVLDVRIPVKEMKSGKGGLDKNMRKSLKAEEFPEIQFHLLNYQTLASTITADGILIKATGQLKIAGVEKTIDIDAQAIKNQEGVKIEGTKELLMTDYGIKPPTLLMIKTRDLVVVYFDFLIDEKTEKP
jgi:polyisoprenoid-binding protein YceI